MLSQLTHIKSDPLDVLLFGVGLRLAQLAKSDNAKFKSLLENRNFTIQLGSEAEGINRYYTIKDGRFSQESGEATDPTLSIKFKDSMTGAKLLTKGDATAFMVGIQNGDLKMTGDYSLLMWFNQVAKFIVPKVPEPLQPVVEHAKPLLQKAMPLAQGLFAKVQSLLGGDETTETKKSKYFDEENTKNTTTDSTDSKLDTLKSKANELKEEVGEKLDELKSDAKEKLDEAKAKLDDVKEQAETKFADVKGQAETKLSGVKETATDKLEATKAKVEEVKEKADSKLDALNEEAKEKISEVKEKAEEKLDEKPSLEALKAEAESKLQQGKTDIAQKLDSAKDTVKNDIASLKDAATEAKSDAKSAINSTSEVDDVTPAVAQSQKLEAKHADDEVIAENVVTKAVKDDKSPITNISVTRNEDKSTDGKPTIVVQDKDGNAYKSK